jgi:hypothetical protein
VRGWSLIRERYDDNPLVTSAWTPRFADLTGKAVIVTGDLPALVDIVGGLAANGALTAVIGPRRELLDAAVGLAVSSGATAVGMTADPTGAAVWERLAPQIEQRLGPIDIVIAAGDETMRSTVRTAVQPDMAARRRGVVVEIGAQVQALELPPGVRHRGIECDVDRLGGADAGLVAVVLLCASDAVTAASLHVDLGQPDG